MAWGFYGRRAELTQLQDILSRNRWFFAKVVGRRRIGKTTLIQEALRAAKRPGVLYVQIPDSGPAGVLSAVDDAFETFRIDPAVCPRPHSLSEFAKAIGVLAQAGYVVALDEFQYFTRAHLADFPSFLQREVDTLSAKASSVSGGLLVLGSIHAEIQALLEDKSAPLFNRTTDEILLSHLDIASVLEVLRHHATPDPGRLLSLWTLFEGVPKFYRDCFEQGVLGADRSVVLRRMFFESSSPLRTEADNWFLKELKGRYDVVLKYVARHEGCTNGELEALDEAGKRIRFGSCKRSEGALARDLTNFQAHVQRFLNLFPKYKSWTSEFVGFSPIVGPDARKSITARGVMVQDLSDLTAGL